jgi:hypothetical protein
MKSDYKSNGHGHGSEGPAAAPLRNVDVGHEIDHVHIRSIVTFLVFLTIMTIGSYFLMWGMFRILNGQERVKELESPRSPVAMTSDERLPPEPRLQSAPGFGEALQKETGAKQSEKSAGPREPPKDPLWEIDTLREHWDAILNDGVKDQSGRVLILPIEDAKKALLEQSWPPHAFTYEQMRRKMFPQSVPVESTPSLAIEMPTAASSGRTTEKRRQ